MKIKLKPYKSDHILKFKGLSYAAELIRSSSIYLADPTSFNDPFDCYFLELLRIIEKEKGRSVDELSDVKQINVFCCCPPENISSSLMWSHYGASHRGVAIKYRIPEKAKSNIFHVIYDEKRHLKLVQKLKPTHPSQDIDIDEETLIASAYHKNKEWKYENELRYIRKRYELKNNLEDDWPVAEVYLGSQFLLNSREELFDIINIIAACRKQNVPVRKMQHKLGSPLTPWINTSPHFNGNCWGELHREIMLELKNRLIASPEGELIERLIHEKATEISKRVFNDELERALGSLSRPL